MRVRQLHPWDASPAEAMRIQGQLARQVVQEGQLDPASVRTVAGADISVAGKRGRAAVVILSYPDLDVVEHAVAEAEVTFPYIPGLLAFREVPILAQAFAQVEAQPGLLVVDGHGYSHFRRFGIACHLGLLLDIPAIGCAKSRLCGEHGPVGDEPDSRAQLVDEGEVIGLLVRTRPGVRPVYASVGHRIALDEAADWVLRLCRGYRLPEPTRLADQLAGGRLAIAAAPKEPSQQLSLF
ncbi:MAG: deoxyribonuclease V [Dehalococcoidia bacterium]